MSPSSPDVERGGPALPREQRVRLQPDPDRDEIVTAPPLTWTASPSPLVDSPSQSQDHDQGRERSGDSLMHDPHVQHSDSSATVSSDEFDWDAENDVAPSSDAQKRAASRGRALWLAFMKVPRIIRVIFIGGIGAGILIAPEVVVETHFRSSPALPTVRMWSLWFAITWAASVATYALVDIVPKIIIHVTSLAGGKVATTRTFLELTLAVSGWLKLTLDITWSWIAFSLLRDTLHPPGTYWTILNRVMQVLFATGLLLLGEKIFLNFVAIRFHHKALADRITENRFALNVLDHLSNVQITAPRRSAYGKKKGHRVGESSSGYPTTPVREDMLPLTPMSEKGSPPDTPSGLEGGDAARRKKKQRRSKRITSLLVDQLGDAFETVGLRSTRHRAGDFQSLHSAKKLARELFGALSNVKPSRKYLIVSDFYPYFKTAQDAQTAFNVFDKDENGDISKVEMREAVQRIYRERKALTAGLKDIDAAVAKLDAVMISILLIVMIFICLLVFDRSDTLSSLVPLATIILGFSFIFGHSAQLLFESMIFIFSTHVYDVGDLVMIDDQALVVKEFGLFSTVFRRTDGQEIIAPNTLLSNSKLVHNLRRSKSMWEDITLQVAFDTPLEIVEQLRNRISKYVSENGRGWSNSTVNIDTMAYQNCINLVISLEHRSNWQDWGGRWGRRTAFMRFLKQTLEELELKYTKPVQPILLPKNTGQVFNAVFSQQQQRRQNLGESRSPPPSSSMTAGGELGNAGVAPRSERNRAPVLTIRDSASRF